MRRLEKCTYFTGTILGIALRKGKEHQKTEDTDRKIAPWTILYLQSLGLLTHENAAYRRKQPKGSKNSAKIHKFWKDSEFKAVQRCADRVDLEKC